MAVITRILCPVDLSDHSRLALDEAVALGRHYGATVTALYVIPPITPAIATLDSPAYVYTPEELAVIGQEVRSFVAGETGDQDIESLVIEGYVVSTILSIAHERQIDLIVVGTHGRSGVQRVILGSIAERVLAHATCPVMTVPPHVKEAVPFGRSMFGNVLCAVDDTPAATRAVAFATALAREADATLTLVNVVEPPSVFDPVLAQAAGAPDYRGMLVTAAHTRLRESLPPDLARRSRARDLVLMGKPYEAILQAAHEQKSDVIVLGAHGGLASLLGVGSTTNHVVREAECPVISIRA